MVKITKGSCNCGRVRWQVEGELRHVVACHCTQCRKQSGHFFAATNAPTASLSIQGADHLKWYQSSADARRGFCRECGSALFWKFNDAETTSILAGSIDGNSKLRLAEHIHVADKGDYYDITDGLPQRDP